MTAIDVWAQITTERMAKRPWLETLLRWTGRAAGELQTVESTVRAMDAAGVDIALLSARARARGQPDQQRGGGATDRGCAVARFRGLATVDLEAPMEAVREIRRWVDRKTFVGVRVVPWLWGLPPNDRRYYPVYAACIDAGVPFCTQIGHTGPLRRSEWAPMLYLEDVMLEFPELVVVGGHVGFPWLDELVTMTVKFPNFHVDTSAYVVRRLPPAFVRWMKGIGKDRVMFGTNWPMLAPQKCLEGLSELGLTGAQREAFLHGNARRVFGL